MTQPWNSKPEPEAQVYEANESDWDDDGNYIGAQDDQAPDEDDYWDDGEDEGENDWEPQVQWYATTTTNKKGKAKEVARELPDVADLVYYDDLGLVNCWESALSDYKVRILPLPNAQSLGHWARSMPSSCATLTKFLVGSTFTHRYSAPCATLRGRCSRSATTPPCKQTRAAHLTGNSFPSSL